MRGPFEAESQQWRWTLASVHGFKPFFQTVIVSLVSYFVLFLLLHSQIIWLLTNSFQGWEFVITFSEGQFQQACAGGVKGLSRTFQTSKVHMNVIIICHKMSYAVIAFIASPRSVQFVISTHVAIASIWHCNICCRCLLWTPSTPSKVRAFISIAEQSQKSSFFCSRIATAVSSRWNSCVARHWSICGP